MSEHVTYVYPISSCSSRGLVLFLPGKGEGQRGESTWPIYGVSVKIYLRKKKTKKKKQQKTKCTISLNLILILITFITIPRGRGHSDFYVHPATLKTTIYE